MKTLIQKSLFKIALFSSCPIYGKLKFDKENKGYLKSDEEIIEMLEEAEIEY